MKKTIFAALALSIICALFFSCESSDGLAENEASLVAVETQEDAQKDSGLEESAQESGDASSQQDDSLALEEKIPESEMDELAGLLNGESAASEEAPAPASSAASEESAAVEEISAADKGAEADPRNAVKESAAEKSAAKESGSARRQDESVSLAEKIRLSNKESETLDGQDASLARVTSQDNKIQGGPLIGPGSDKIPGGKNEAQVSNKEPAQESDEAIDLESSDEEDAPEEKPEPVPSRRATIKNNQFFDVAYPGSGWIYLGEEGAGDHFIFQGRKLGNGGTTFTLRSKKPGTALLHFYKNDILTGDYIDDYLEVSITDKSATDSAHAEAPSYAEIVPPKFDRTKAVQEKKAEQEAAASAPSAPQKDGALQSKGTGGQAKSEGQDEALAKSQAENSPSEKVQTVIQTSGQEKGDSKQKTAVAGTSAPKAGESEKNAPTEQAPSAGSDKAKSLLERARKAYDEKRYAEALDLVQQFFDTASEDIDAGLYLEGLILEAKSEVRNIKSAIGAYDTLIKNWPQSDYWRKANERSIYLKRFYIDIR